ncbi:hypothetical protein GFB49_09575 [Epibacterium sp. SM1979]|uniref:Uncharacterized protein n=1 Tax=Tritonibacter litoralis TaxID=2662264 RepID=A0A843YCN6_9RHOB|nr:hypothetical protein [Tritonibacter litoralis]MQQ08701.1 hypothetical protein [Tritonibacter litoralis]
MLEGASGVFERGGKKTLEIGEEQVKELHAKIGECAMSRHWSERQWRMRLPTIFGPESSSPGA